jgi:hypothetical protein
MLFHLAQHLVNDPINIMGPVPLLEKKKGQRDNKIYEKLRRKYELEEKNVLQGNGVKIGHLGGKKRKIPTKRPVIHLLITLAMTCWSHKE